MELLQKIFRLITVAFLVALTLYSDVYAQRFQVQPYYHIKKGDSLFAVKQYLEANTEYLKAIDKDAKPKRDIYYTIALGYHYMDKQKLACRYLEYSVKSGLAFFNIHEFEKDVLLKDILLVNGDSTYFKQLRQNTYQFENSDSLCEYPDLRDELLKRKKLDQKYRNHGLEEQTLMAQRNIDQENQAFLTACIEKIGGWPGYKEVGRKGQRAAALFAIHSMDSTFQKYVLTVMEPQLDSANMLFGNYALLWDKLYESRSQDQIFGTQVKYDNQTGKAYPLKLKYPELIDVLRALYVGVPLKEYLEMMSTKIK